MADLCEFVPNRRHGLARRVADLLDWAGVRKPRQHIPLGVVAQVVFGVRTELGVRSPLVEQVRRELHRVRAHLNGAGRDLVRERAALRASVDRLDLLTNTLHTDLRLYRGRARRLGKTLLLARDHRPDQRSRAEPWIEAKLAQLAGCFGDLAPQLGDIERGLRELVETTARVPRD